ncbi:hypothetical protein EYF80_049278 [Liparis tanakae]|uniref:Uncharacterized protein n=1 Tax=Liparis tanakae TaxID=230148 RepID=A0A4Z2FH59_9TELE|nr:hypothetical protein EYF80_049278 [Liparis tanakae]
MSSQSAGAKMPRATRARSASSTQPWSARTRPGLRATREPRPRTVKSPRCPSGSTCASAAQRSAHASAPFALTRSSSILAHAYSGRPGAWTLWCSSSWSCPPDSRRSRTCSRGSAEPPLHSACTISARRVSTSSGADMLGGARRSYSRRHLSHPGYELARATPTPTSSWAPAEVRWATREWVGSEVSVTSPRGWDVTPGDSRLPSTCQPPLCFSFAFLNRFLTNEIPLNET